LFISAIKTLLGPPWTDTGEPGAVTNNDCCDAVEGVLPERQEMNETADAVSNKVNRATRLIAVGILITEVTPISFRSSLDASVSRVLPTKSISRFEFTEWMGDLACTLLLASAHLRTITHRQVYRRTKFLTF
jgi:hypothetical protein